MPSESALGSVGIRTKHFEDNERFERAEPWDGHDPFSGPAGIEYLSYLEKATGVVYQVDADRGVWRKTVRPLEEGQPFPQTTDWEQLLDL